MTKQLTQVKATEVSLVDRAANKRRFLFTKQQGDAMALDEVKALETVSAIDKAGQGGALEKLAGSDPEGLEDFLKGVDEEDREDVRATVKIMGLEKAKKIFKARFGGTKPAAPKQPGPQGSSSGAGFSNPPKGKLGKKKKKNKGVGNSGQGQGGNPEDYSMAGGGAGADKGPQAYNQLGGRLAGVNVTKSADGHVSVDGPGVTDENRATFEAFAKEIIDGREAVLKMQEANARNDMIAFIKRDLNSLPKATPDDFTAVLLDAQHRMTKANYDKLCDVLKGASVLLAKSKLFAEIGSSGAGANSAYQRVCAMAEEVRKEHKKWTPAMARAEVLKKHPELYDEYERERAALAAQAPREE